MSMATRMRPGIWVRRIPNDLMANTCHRRLRKGSSFISLKPYGTIWGRAVIVSILRFVTGILEPEKRYEDESRLRSVAADLSEQLN